MTTTAITTTAPISASSPEWLQLKAAATALQALQVQDGSVPEAANHEAASRACPHHLGGRPGPGAGLPARRRLPRPPRHRLRPLGRRRLRRARLPRLPAGVPAAAAPGERTAAPGGLPDVHAERQQQPPGRGRADRGHLARVHRRPGGGRILQQALRPDPLPRLHPRLRHQLRGAVPGNRRGPRDPDVHVGRHLRRPRGRPLPPRPARRRGHHLPAASRGRRRAAGGPGADARKRS